MKHSDSNHSFKETLFGILFLCTIIGAVFAIYITSQTDIFLCLIGGGVSLWGVVNLLEGYGNDNPGAKVQ